MIRTAIAACMLLFSGTWAVADSGSLSVHLHSRPGNLALVGTARLRCSSSYGALIVSSNLTTCAMASNPHRAVLHRRPVRELRSRPFPSRERIAKVAKIGSQRCRRIPEFL